MPSEMRMARPTTVARPGAMRRRTISTGVDAPLFGAVAILLGDHEALQRPQQPDRQNENQRHPQQHMHPEWRAEGELDEERQADDDEADDHDDEYSWPVAG